ncbi:MAG: hypothetical protein SFT94_05360 [Pseudanabaenaceae cyanobacterium bins.68]|nr:hypothetical protein [Pseudanabaenaceae cyanobacterium bins.68]
MNAAEKACTIELAAKIASTVTLFKQLFPDAKADLRPWLNDPDTNQLVDPDSIDLSFSFPGINRQIPSRAILVQIRFSGTSMIGVEIAGYSHQGKQWSFSTVADWQVHGIQLPPIGFEHKIKQFGRDLFELF